MTQFHKKKFFVFTQGYYAAFKKNWIVKSVLNTLKKYWIWPKCTCSIEKVWKFQISPFFIQFFSLPLMAVLQMVLHCVPWIKFSKNEKKWWYKNFDLILKMCGKPVYYRNLICMWSFACSLSKNTAHGTHSEKISKSLWGRSCQWQPALILTDVSVKNWWLNHQMM